MATYGSVNLASFKPNRLKDLVEEEYYSQRAIEEFDSARFKMRLYVAGSAERTLDVLAEDFLTESSRLKIALC